MSLAKILIVDDDERVRQALRRVLGRLDYELHLADRAISAFEILRTHDIDVVISDHTMPGISGLEFLRAVRHQYPGAIRIMLTGHADRDTAIQAINEGEVFRLLEKPWDNQELHMALVAACERRRRADRAS